MASSRARTIRRAYSTSALPASVSETSCRSRAKSGMPSSSSSFLMLWLMAGCVRPTRSAARVKVPSSATARKCSSCSRSIRSGPRCYLCLMNVPFFSSAYACCISSRGVHHDRPVPRDRLFERPSRHEQEPDALVAGRHRDLVAAVEEHERSIAEHRRRRIVGHADELGLDRQRLRRIAERAGSGKHVGKRVTRRLDRQCAWSGSAEPRCRDTADRRRRPPPAPSVPRNRRPQCARACRRRR